MKHLHLHLVSDSTGETVNSVARAAMAQFENVTTDEHIYSLIRSTGQMEKVIDEIRQTPGVVMYTLVNSELRDMLRLYCHQNGIPCVPVLSRAVAELQTFLGIENLAEPGRQHELNEDYYSRVEAIDYTLAHDDGQATWDLEEADIVIVGVSRTSKSPTCVYLANRGLKAANVPFVHHCPLPENLESLTKPLVVGLTIDPDHLQLIRENRLESLHTNQKTDYVNREEIIAELAAARKLCQRNRWPVIDVTRRSVEETSATIIHYHKKHLNRLMQYGSQNG